MMTSDEFKALPEWQLIRGKIEASMYEALESAINSPDHAAKEFHRGVWITLREVAGLPDLLLVGNEKPETDPVVEGLDILKSRPSSGSAW